MKKHKQKENKIAAILTAISGNIQPLQDLPKTKVQFARDEGDGVLWDSSTNAPLVRDPTCNLIVFRHV